ncbi:MAG: SpoIID/LytB domain-containing protein [Bacteroidales bacterium]|nr:SpoIID/LytB domain-containing protein [Bacteroidales bacterium]
MQQLQTDIQVGIMFAPKISFCLHGTYILESTGEEFSGKGAIEMLPHGAYRLELNGRTRMIQLPVLFAPLNKDDASFELNNVTIGINFHWERQEDQHFTGSLKVIAEEGHLTAINILPIEDYLKSVISSEMNANASAEFLKAHAVISRSWLLAQIEKARAIRQQGESRAPATSWTHKPCCSDDDIQPEKGSGKPYETSPDQPDEEHIRWYDREDHHNFDVCADDHCQRYQGITRASTPEVGRAIDETSGEVLMYDGRVCDARYSKCCGGISERFENVWEAVYHPYLEKVVDHPSLPKDFDTDLDTEQKAERWIRNAPEAFCNTTDKQILSQVLNDYDLETPDFFRWQQTMSQQEVKTLLKSRIGIDVGDVLEIKPLERGVSGRLIKLMIRGSKRTRIIGKELEIRKAFSRSHLYSAAFVVDPLEISHGVPQKFIFTGAGWGHGVGLCQIGAAVMGAGDYSYKQILSHYFKEAVLAKAY